MTVWGVLIVCGVAISALASGFAIRRYVAGKGGRKALAVAAILPLFAYWLWGVGLGCVFGNPSLPAVEQQCFGWGFGLVMFAVLAMPPWLLGLVLGYASPWAPQMQKGVPD